MVPHGPSPRSPEQEQAQARREQLLGRAATGNEQARNQLLEELLPLFRNRIRRSLFGGCRDAESDVLVSVVRRICAWGGPLPPTLRRFLGWVGIIVRNRCVEEWRRRTREPAPLAPLDDVAGSDEGAESEEEKDRRAADVWSAIQLLPDHYRTVVERTFYGRKSDRDIGLEMGLSEEAVRILRWRALKKIRALTEKRHDHQ